jgi:hypothetical protein
MFNAVVAALMMLSAQDGDMRILIWRHRLTDVPSLQAFEADARQLQNPARDTRAQMLQSHRPPNYYSFHA